MSKQRDRMDAINERLKKVKFSSPVDLQRWLEARDLKASLRTIKRDIERMKYDEQLGLFAPICYSKANKGYYYKIDSYSIRREMTRAEMLALVESLSKAIGEWWEGRGYPARVNVSM